MSETQIREMIRNLTGLLGSNEVVGGEEGSEVTFADLAARYLERCISIGQASASTRSRLKGLTEFFGAWPASMVDERAWCAYRAARRTGCSAGGHVAVSTSNVELAMTKTVFALAVEEQRISRNPLAKVKPERGANRRRETLSEAELQRILGACEAAWFRAYIILLADTGMRRSEGIKLTWGDVDRGHAHVSRENSKGKVARTVALTARAQGACMGLRRVEGNGFVFASQRAERAGKCIAPSCLSAMFRKAVVAAGVTLASGKLPVLHHLRHSFASRASRGGAPLTAISAALGHSSLQTTQGYLHVEQRDVDGAVACAYAAAVGTHSGTEMRP